MGAPRRVSKLTRDSTGDHSRRLGFGFSDFYAVAANFGTTNELYMQREPIGGPGLLALGPRFLFGGLRYHPRPFETTLGATTCLWRLIGGKRRWESGNPSAREQRQREREHG